MKSSEALRKIMAGGWKVKSQSGSHIKLIHPNIKSTIIFPNHGSKELGKGLQKKLFKQAGIS